MKTIEQEIAEEFEGLCENDLEEVKSIGFVYQNLQASKDYKSGREFTLLKSKKERPFNVRKVKELNQFSILVLSDNCIIKSCLNVGITVPTGLRWIDKLETLCNERQIPFFIDWEKHAPYGKTKTTIKNNAIINYGNRRLDEKKVSLIKFRLNQKDTSFHNIALLLGCSPSTVGYILNGFSWNYIQPYTYRQVELAERRILLGTASKLDHEILYLQY